MASRGEGEGNPVTDIDGGAALQLAIPSRNLIDRPEWSAAHSVGRRSF